MQRNPYLILGVEFGASHDEARRQFALAARRLRRDPDGAQTVEDLTWALNEIESLNENPEDLVHVFRVPANPIVFVPHGDGLFRPPPVAMDRRTPTSDPSALQDLRAAAALEFLAELVRAYSAGTEIDLAYQRSEGT